MTFHRNAGRQDAVERGDAIAGDEQKRIIKIKNVANFPALEGFHSGEINSGQCIHGRESRTIGLCLCIQAPDPFHEKLCPEQGSACG